MSNKNVLAAVGIIAVLLVVVAGIYYVLLRSGSARSKTPVLTSFAVTKPNFVATGSYLGKVEVWVIPTGTGIEINNYQKIGEAVRSGASGANETWTMPIPSTPILATQIFARGFGPKGEDAGEVNLPYTGATELWDAIWGTGAPARNPSAISEADNGKTIELTETSRFTLQLSASKYKEGGLSITPQGILGQTFGASSEPGMWVRTYEAVAPGSATIVVPGIPESAPPFVLHVRVVVGQ